MPILTDIIELKEAIEDSKRKKLKFRIRNPFKKIKLDFDKFDNVLYAKDFEECDPRQCDGKWITGSEKNDLIFDRVLIVFWLVFAGDMHSWIIRSEIIGHSIGQSS